jgi:hypothetical protein
MVTVDFAAEEGGNTYSEKIPNWIFYPAGLLMALLLFWILRIGRAWLRDIKEQSEAEKQKQAKKLAKKAENKSRAPVAPLKKSPSALKKSPKDN